MKALMLFTSAFILIGIYSTALGGNIRKVIPAAGKRVDVPEAVMNEIYDKSNIIRDRSESLGYPFVMFYNGKIKNGYKRIVQGIIVTNTLLFRLKVCQQQAGA